MFARGTAEESGHLMHAERRRSAFDIQQHGAQVTRDPITRRHVLHQPRVTRQPLHMFGARRHLLAESIVGAHGRRGGALHHVRPSITIEQFFDSHHALGRGRRRARVARSHGTGEARYLVHLMRNSARAESIGRPPQDDGGRPEQLGVSVGQRRVGHKSPSCLVDRIRDVGQGREIGNSGNAAQRARTGERVVQRPSMRRVVNEGIQFSGDRRRLERDEDWGRSSRDW